MKGQSSGLPPSPTNTNKGTFDSFPLTDTNPELAEALAQFQSKHCNAAKDGKGNFGKYVTLTEAELAVSPATEFGLSHTFIMRPCTETMAAVAIKLMHTSGEYEFSELPIFFNKGRNPYHEMGSGITYVRRYLLLAAYGLGQADDEADTFSRETQDNTGNTKEEKKAPWSEPELTKVKGFSEDEQPLTEERRNLCIGLVKEYSPEQRKKFVTDFCKHFSLPSGTKIQGEITAVKHEKFLGGWTP